MLNIGMLVLIGFFIFGSGPVLLAMVQEKNAERPSFTNGVYMTINFLLGWLAYHEELDATRIVGFSLIWVALAVLATDTARRAQRSRYVTT